MWAVHVLHTRMLQKSIRALCALYRYTAAAIKPSSKDVQYLMFITEKNEVVRDHQIVQLHQSRELYDALYQMISQ